ncbi:hypothetical protein CHCC20442_2516 [Bacillus licheniformis]|nr:hypothetical protein CHCC20442_2516 [Bacillus licheniformis]
MEKLCLLNRMQVNIKTPASKSGVFALDRQPAENRRLFF